MQCPVTSLCAVHVNDEDSKVCDYYVPAHGNTSFKLGSSYHTTVYIDHISSQTRSPLCNMSAMFSEHAQYLLVVNSSEKHCYLFTIEPGDGEYLREWHIHYTS